MSALRLLAACVASSVVTALGFAGPAFAGAPTPTSAEEAGLWALVVPDAQPLLGGEQVSAQRDAERVAPAAIAGRKESVTRFEGLNTTQAERLAGESFPQVVNDPAGGPPRLAPGERIVRYQSDHTAQVDLPGGKHGVIDSLAPIAVETNPGSRVPVDLSLSESAGRFQPKTPAQGAQVSIPKHLGDGAFLSSLGVSLTPVDGHGAALGGSDGVLDGAAVFYGNTENLQAGVSDVDTMIKPDALGFSVETLLRSQRSPQQLYFRVGLPSGASLEPQKGSGSVQVLDAGQTISTIPAPLAHDAEGTLVPVSMTVSGDTIIVSVPHQADQYRFPIEVDPTVADTSLHAFGTETNWVFERNNGEFVQESGSPGVVVWSIKATTGKWSLFGYATQGKSRIYEFVSETASSGEKVENEVGIVNSSKTKEAFALYGSSYGPISTQLCAEAGCATGTVTTTNQGNVAYFQQIGVGSTVASFTAKMTTATVKVLQEEGPPAPTYNESSPTVKGETNILYSHNWFNALNTNVAFEATATDPGIGLNSWTASAPTTPEWKFTDGTNSYACIECEIGTTARPLTLTYYVTNNEIRHIDSNLGTINVFHTLAEGEDTINLKVSDATGLAANAAPVKLKVDDAAPHNLTVTGLPAENSIGEQTYHFTVKATDGEGTTPSSGIKSVVVAIDAKNPVTLPAACSPGPCTVSAESTINGQELSTGRHEILVTATDGAGNVKQEATWVLVRHSSPVGDGPGGVNPQSGEFSLRAKDVSLGGGLTVSRSYRSRHLTTGPEDPLGSIWGFSLGHTDSIVKLPNESMELTEANGEQVSFTSDKKGGFISPEGDPNLKLAEVVTEGVKELVLSNSATGTSTGFRVPAGGSEETWMPSIEKSPVPTDTATFAFETITVGGLKVVRPTEVLAPVPPGVSCSPTLLRGCRALTFNYAASTTATGESRSLWGDYQGQLTRVYFHAWDPSTNAMKEVVVAQYAYDLRGRLRAEWDPQISPELKTTYGYGAEGRVTALSEPGQEPWVFSYGTIASDTGNGRLLKMMRPTAQTALWNGELVKNTELPKISGEAYQGVRLAVSNGLWSNGALTYSYQWDDCSATGTECKPIAGATNANYTLAASDVGHKLVAQVTAANAGGSVLATSATTAEVKTVSITEYGTAAGSEPLGITAGPDSNVWFTGSLNNTVGKMTTTGGSVTEYALPAGSTPHAITAGWDGKLWFVATGANKIGKITTTGTEKVEYALPTGSTPEDIVSGPDHNLWFTDNGTSKIGKITVLGTKTEYTLPTGSNPARIVSGPDGNLWFTDNGTNKIGKITTAGTITEYALPSSSKPIGIASGPDGNLWFTDSGTNKVGKITTAGAITEYSAGIAITPYGIVPGSDGNLWFTSSATSSVSRITTSGTLTSFTLPKTTRRMAVGPDNNVWFSVPSTNKLTKINLKPTEGEAKAPAAGGAIEYNVPLSGSGAPYAMSAAEVEKWRELDLPLEAAAIFPPDEPEGWPAGDYRRATVYYLDKNGRLVNVATPGGGISTTEYNSKNDVEATLTADNRVAALKEGAKSSEVAYQLMTLDSYNSEGTELLGTFGPRHLVKLSNGREVQARNHSVYSYDEGAPTEGSPYRLVTKLTQGAYVEGEAEQDVRIVTTSYSGQEGLGWKLRRPTSVTTDPGGLNLTRKAVYDPVTGNVLETTGATGAAENAPPAYALNWGSAGKENGQFAHPMGEAIDTSGNIWVADGYNNRIQKFSSTGSFLAAYGKEGTSQTEVQFKEPVGIAINKTTGNLYVSDQNNSRVMEISPSGTVVRVWGKSGTGNGEFKDPAGVAIDSSGNVWVTDYLNNRVQKFNESGGYLGQFGTTGKEKGQFSGASGIAVSGENIYVTDLNDSRVEEFNEGGNKFVREWGTAGAGNGQFKIPTGVAVAPNGNVYVVDNGNQRVQEFSSTGTFILSFGSKGTDNGQFTEPEGVTIASSGAIYVADAGTNNRISEFVSNSGGAHTTQTVYYSSAANPKYPACGEHAEWANLACQTGPAAQPATSGLPELPVTTYTYNIWDEPETVSQTVGSSTRTLTDSYDAGGRQLTSARSSTVGTPLPTVTDEYNSETGVLVGQSTTVEGKSQSVSEVVNRLGEVTSYTDADGNISTFEYEPENGARLTKVNDGKGVDTYVYDETTGATKEVIDSAVGKFVGNYDVEGKLTSEEYPNGMSASYAYNQAGEATALEYVKTTHCSSGCTWYSDNVVPSIHGQYLSQASSLAGQSYTYDNAGRLTQVQETPAGLGCTSRIYGYDQDTNRTSLTMREPGLEGKCAAEGGTVETHTYDTADRLVEGGIGYDAFGNITTLPGHDAGGSEVVSSFYSNDALASQTQAGETIGYQLDPGGRVREIVSTGKVAATAINHYTGAGDALAWTSEISGAWTRYIDGINGVLVAVQKNGETPVLQLSDLSGNVVATAALSETETKLLSMTRSTEYGVPTSESPPKYSWLGAYQMPTELSSGIVHMGARSYIPQLGRFLQTDPVAGGSANAYAYTFGDPVNTADLSGEATLPGWFIEFVGGNANQRDEEVAARERAAREEAERKAAEAAAAAAAALETSSPGEGAMLPLGGYEGWSCEYAEETGQEYDGCGGGSGGKPRAVAASGKYNACLGHPRPHSSERCCFKGNEVTSKTPAGSHVYPCDVAPARRGCHEVGCQPAYIPKRQLECPDGSSPGIGYFTGRVACIPDGSDPPSADGGV